MNHTDDTPEVVYPEGLVDAIRDLFDQYWPLGVESAVIEMRQMLMSAADGMVNLGPHCPVCNGKGRCDPIPVKGRQGIWQWDGTRRPT